MHPDPVTGKILQNVASDYLRPDSRMPQKDADAFYERVRDVGVPGDLIVPVSYLHLPRCPSGACHEDHACERSCLYAVAEQGPVQCFTGTRVLLDSASEG